MDPPFASPLGKRLTRPHAEIIDLGVISLGRKFGILEPLRGKLIATVRHIFPAEHTEREHFLGGKIGTEVRMKLLSFGRNERIPVSSLHAIIYKNSFRHKAYFDRGSSTGELFLLPQPEAGPDKIPVGRDERTNEAKKDRYTRHD